MWFWMHFRKCKIEWNSVSSYQTCGLRNPQGGALEGSLKEKRTATPSSTRGKVLPSWRLMVIFCCCSWKKRWHRGVGGSPFALVFNCYKSHLLPCVLPQREHYPPQQPGLAIPGSSDCSEVNPSPPHDSGAALSPRLSASSSGRPLWTKER